MRFGLFILLLWGLGVGCTPEFVPDEVRNRDENAVLLPTEDPSGQTGEVTASFLSSEHDFTFSESNMSSTTLRVSYVTTARNFDVFKWVFEGGTSPTDIGSTTTVSGTNEYFLTIEGNLQDDTADQIGVLVEYRDGFGRYDVTHAVANSTNVDVNLQKHYVTYEYLDDLQTQQGSSTQSTSTVWINGSDSQGNVLEGWFGPDPSENGTVTYGPCADALVGFYQTINGNQNEITSISKDFSGFGRQPKNLVFEYKLEFLILPTTNEEYKKISLAYTPIVPGVTNNVELTPTELWEDSTLDVTDYRQVVIPLPLIENFRLSFNKHPSILNEQGQQRFPFNVCIRDVRIIPGNEGD